MKRTPQDRTNNSKTAEDWFKKGLHLWDRYIVVGEFGETGKPAINAFKRVTKIDPNYVSAEGDTAYHYLALLHQHKHQWKEAVEYYTKTLKLEPKSGVCVLRRAHCYLYMRNEEEGVKDLKTCLKMRNDDGTKTEALETLCELYVAKKDYKKARLYARKLHEAIPEYYDELLREIEEALEKTSRHAA